MYKRLFFLKQDGWFEAELTGKLLYASDEELLLWAHAVMERKNYRNYLITENPGNLSSPPGPLSSLERGRVVSACE